MVEAALSGAPLGLTAYDDPPEHLSLTAAWDPQHPLPPAPLGQQQQEGSSNATSGAAAVSAAPAGAVRAQAAASAAALGGGAKIAFMFLTRGPMPLAPIWERFFQASWALAPTASRACA